MLASRHTRHLRRLFSARFSSELSSSRVGSVRCASLMDQSTSPQQKIADDLPYQSKPLGSPLPFDEHACSVSLPTWSSVVGYEEGDEAVTSSMQCGYPRFVYHPYILQLMQVIIDKHGNPNAKEDCIVLPSKAAAMRCRNFLRLALEGDASGADNALVERPGVESGDESPSEHPSRIRAVSLENTDVYGVIFPAQTTAGGEAKAYWQHTGEIVSSRLAERALCEIGACIEKRVTCCPIEGTPAILHSSDREECSTDSSFTQLQDRIVEWTGVPRENVFLAPSGMGAIYRALRSSRRFQLEKDPSSKGGTSIVFGFPYLDTLKMCSRSEFCPSGVEFFGHGDEGELQLLERVLKRRTKSNWSAVLTEVPSNPLLQCPDLEKLRELADEHDFCLIVDDTIGNFLNVDLIESGLADAVCTSLTKLVSGRGDAIAGSVVANPNTEKGRWMQEDLSRDVDTYGGLYSADARAMVVNSQDFEERNAKINDNTEQLAEFLHNHPDVETVWHPKLSAPLYPNYLKPGGGYGGLFSMHLYPHMCQRTFYDALDVAKGPSLGTNYTLVCPYTLLAHYHELDFAMSYNVPPNLIRVAVGLEDIDELKSKFESAIAKSRLHPKLTTKMANAAQ